MGFAEDADWHPVPADELFSAPQDPADRADQGDRVTICIVVEGVLGENALVEVPVANHSNVSSLVKGFQLRLTKY